MIGTLNSIYFTPDGHIPELVLNNVKQIALEANDTGYAVCFWTDIRVLSETSKDILNASGVIIRDYYEVMRPLRDIIARFVGQGHQGDITSYVLASDLLRVAAAEIAPSDQLYIYADANDIVFTQLARDLKNLSSPFYTNPWGLSFPACATRVEQQIIGMIRNDVMLFRRDNNPDFIDLFLSQFAVNAQIRTSDYLVTSDQQLNKKQLDYMSCFTSQLPFNITRAGDRITMAYVSQKMAPLTDIDALRYIQFKRVLSAGNSWRSEAQLADDHEIDEAIKVAWRESACSDGSASSGGMFARPRNRNIILSKALDINVAEIASYFPDFLHRQPFLSTLQGMIDSELILSKDLPNPTDYDMGHESEPRVLFSFDGKTPAGFTKISTEYTPLELSDLLLRLPESLAEPLKEALIFSGFLSKEEPMQTMTF